MPKKVSMTKNVPTPSNDVFDHDKEYLHEAAGIAPREEIADRIMSLNGELETNKTNSLSVVAEEVYKHFNHKELACMWVMEVVGNQRNDDAPLEEIIEALFGGAEPDAQA